MIFAELLFAISALVWLVVLVAYLRHWMTDRAVLVSDLLDPVAAPFAALVVITPMLLASGGLYSHAPTAGRILTDVFVVLTVLLGGWFTGQWIYGPVDLDKFHPGYFLPTVAGGLIASAALSVVGQSRLAEVMFGFGVICWVVLGSIILGRLLFRPMLPPALQPTLAIEVAPAAVASLAWFQMHDGRVDSVTTFLAGYGILMIVAQLRLVPALPSVAVHAQHLGLHLQLGRCGHRCSRLAGERTGGRLPHLAVRRPRNHHGSRCRYCRPHGRRPDPSPATSPPNGQQPSHTVPRRTTRGCLMRTSNDGTGSDPPGEMSSPERASLDQS